MKDPLGNVINVSQEGIGIAKFEIGDVRDSVLKHISKTLQNPACIYENEDGDITKYYFQIFLSTKFMCIVKQKNGEWYLENTLFNPDNETIIEVFKTNKLLYAK